MSEASVESVERTAEMIREFAAEVDDPDKWMIIVPVEDYDEVKASLDTVRDLGAYYQDIALCYGEHNDETTVEYTSNLADHLASSNGGVNESE